ncbi:predicted protein [Nematostella vectensis]|uniref:3'-5' exonuclease domain-containing protein n=2 Tax=Nematostella vectensis TaxID=45351 RepID=A7S9A8_NEMVE|nr:predicted protein [Nematostella vectensis]|eukprot:XP_001631787.1 predicted protein [Nematostella vectensis]
MQRRADIFERVTSWYPRRRCGVSSSLCIKAEDVDAFAKLKENKDLVDCGNVETVFEAEGASSPNVNNVVSGDCNCNGEIEEESKIETVKEKLGHSFEKIEAVSVETRTENNLSDFESTVGDGSASVDHIPNIGVLDDYPDVPLDQKFILPPNWRGMNITKEGVKFSGEIIIISDPKDEAKHRDVIKEFSKKDALGFDTEHCSSQGLVCVIQLASADKAILWHCHNFNHRMPPGLRSLLTGNVYKTGHACLQDAIMISNQFKVHAKNLIDTCHWAKDLHCMPRSLQAMCAIFLGEHLSKRHQQSNWKKSDLSPGQVAYAATDAWVSLRVYQEMKRHGERLGVDMMPPYRTLQNYTNDVRDSRRLKRLRYKRRQKEQRKIVKAETTDDSHIDENSGTEILHEQSHSNQSFEDSKDRKTGDESSDEMESRSSGSRKRNRKFIAKFHSLE